MMMVAAAEDNAGVDVVAVVQQNTVKAMVVLGTQEDLADKIYNLFIKSYF